MTRAEFLERLDGSRYAMYHGGAIRTKTRACACPLEAESGLGLGRFVAAAQLMGIDSHDRHVIMAAADFPLRRLGGGEHGAAIRFRKALIQKIRAANGGALPRKQWPARTP